MARKPLRPCRHAGCPELTRDGWCSKHKPRHQRRLSADYHSWYLQPLWTERLRPAQLARDPWCCVCAKQYPPDDPRHRTCATVVDHKRPHRGDWALFIDPSNHQSMCKHHHDQKTAREQAEDRRKNNTFS